jgi:hypothetical protein
VHYFFLQDDHTDKGNICDKEPDRTPPVAAIVNSSFMNCDIVKARQLRSLFLADDMEYTSPFFK